MLSHLPVAVQPYACAIRKRVRPGKPNTAEDQWAEPGDVCILAGARQTQEQMSSVSAIRTCLSAGTDDHRDSPLQGTSPGFLDGKVSDASDRVCPP